MRGVRFAAAARREFLAEVAYYSQQAPGLGTRFAAAVEAAASRACAFPLAGSRATRNTRRMHLSDFPFALVYRPDDEGIVVFALAHHSRKPGYWMARAEDQ